MQHPHAIGGGMNDNETAQTSSAASWQPSASVSSAGNSAPAVTPASIADDTSEMFGVRYIRARTIWFFGVAVSTSLGAIEWYL